jgi:hypothetical protein
VSNSFLGDVVPKKKRRRRSAICTHHITYNPEWVVKVWTGEHMILTRLQWRRRFSKGFFVALHDFIDKYEKYAVELGDNIETEKNRV